MKVTLEKLAELDACMEGVSMFKNQFGEEAELKDVITWAIDSGNIEAMRNANWLIVRMMERKQYLAYAVYVAKQVFPIYESKFPEDNRLRMSIEAVEACIADDTKSNRDKAKTSAYAAYSAAYSADAAAYAAAYAAYAAAYAANVNHAGYVDYVVSYAVDAVYADKAIDTRKTMMTDILKYGITLIHE